MEFNKIYNMDCLEGMRNLPNECIDCVGVGLYNQLFADDIF